MKISLTELKEMISEAVRAKMNEGPRQVSIEMVLNHEDIKEPTVEEIVEQAKEEATQEVKDGQIIKEIIREVPVEKEVIREVFVDKEVIKEVVVDNSYKPNHFSF